jgi:hypothetical protein
MPDLRGSMPDLRASMPDLRASMPDLRASMPDLRASMPDPSPWCRGNRRTSRKQSSLGHDQQACKHGAV